MKRLMYFLVPVVIIIVAYTIFGGESDEKYVQTIEAKRKERVRFLRSSDTSPFKQFDKPFEPPTYFPVDPEYRVHARLQRFTQTERLAITNSDGSQSFYTKFAYAEFPLKDKELRLLILKPQGFGETSLYFTGFADETSGTSTYGGGRYLDLEIGNSDHVILDFNLAYNPYCAYVDEYQCPFPPEENILPVIIEAGEKDYPH